MRNYAGKHTQLLGMLICWQHWTLHDGWWKKAAMSFGHPPSCSIVAFTRQVL